MTIKIFTRGYLHDLPSWVPTWNVEVDLRELRDPAHVLPEHMRDMRGDLDVEVRTFVLETQGAPELLGRITAEVLRRWSDSDDGDVVVLLGMRRREASCGVVRRLSRRAAARGRVRRRADAPARPLAASAHERLGVCKCNVLTPGVALATFM